jgi:threonine aldolase
MDVEPHDWQASDNRAPVHPTVLDALVDANTGRAAACGDDTTSLDTARQLCERFGAGAVHWAATGTGANIAALDCLGARGNTVVATRIAHLACDEAGAVARQLGGHLHLLDSDNGLIDAGVLDELADLADNSYTPRIAVVSITQATERGVCHPLDNIAAVADATHRLGARLHIDGARLSNACASEASGLDGQPARLFDAGADAVSLGLTKNGALATEAVLFNTEGGQLEATRVLRAGGQTLSKSRYVACQIRAMLHDDLWLDLASRANSAATHLAAELAGRGLVPVWPVDANEVFVHLDRNQTGRLEATGTLGVWDTTGLCRFVTSWDTTDGDINQLVEQLDASGR